MFFIHCVNLQINYFEHGNDIAIFEHTVVLKDTFSSFNFHKDISLEATVSSDFVSFPLLEICQK